MRCSADESTQTGVEQPVSGRPVSPPDSRRALRPRGGSHRIQRALQSLPRMLGGLAFRVAFNGKPPSLRRFVGTAELMQHVPPEQQTVASLPEVGARRSSAAQTLFARLSKGAWFLRIGLRARTRETGEPRRSASIAKESGFERSSRGRVPRALANRARRRASRASSPDPEPAVVGSVLHAGRWGKSRPAPAAAV